ncbi:AAA family ATPase [Paenibacillus sp. FSL K6-2859]|uniref:AAA family ATPase n=1 Tax=Paenibacillus sp. FSL K6-2859 TaxID=2921482 RepID=UPI0030FB6823
MSVNTIVNYIKAAYPVIWVKSFEEERCLKEIGKIAKERAKQLKVWSITQGFMNRVDPSDDSGHEITDPITALEFIKNDTETHTIYVLQSFHFFLEDNPMVLQLLKDLINHCKSHAKSIIFLSCRIVLPVEIEKEVAVLDFDLPNLEELGQILDDILSPSGNAIEVSNRKRILESALGLTAAEAENAFSLAIVVHKALNEESVKTIQQEKANIVKKSGMMEFIPPTNTINDIGGASNFKEWAQKRLKAFTEEARKFGIQPPKGVVLTGIAGNGKSAMAKGLGNFWQLPILRFDVGSVFGSLVGQSEDNMSRALKMAETIAPCIVWIDEIEKAFSGLSSSGSSDGGTTSRVHGYFLTWLQEKKENVFVLATANNIRTLPPELTRKGRFDEIFWFDLPEPEDRKEILSIHLRKRGREPEKFNLDLVVKKTKDFVGAELEQVVVDGLNIAFSEDNDLNTQHLLDAAETTVPLSKSKSTEIEDMRKWALENARMASTSHSQKNSSVVSFPGSRRELSTD